MVIRHSCGFARNWFVKVLFSPLTDTVVRAKFRSKINTNAYWAHSMGPQRSPLSRVVVVVVAVVVVVDIDAQAACDSGGVQ